MTAREYAKAVGVKIVGKLKKKVVIHERYDVKNDAFVEARMVFYIDEAGNEFHKEKGEWVIITADGGVI